MIASAHVPHSTVTFTVAPPPVKIITRVQGEETTIVAPMPGMIICYEVEVGDG
ncbi:hypothetical protein ES703_55819 [subsurface metagenome]